MPHFTDPNMSDEQRLESFIREVRDLLGGVARDGSDHRGNKVVPADLQDDLRAAWHDVNDQFEHMIRALPRSEAGLLEHGLYGPQLAFKLGVVGKIWDRFLREGGLKLYRWLLAAIDTVFDSLIQAVGVGAALRELKEAMASAGETLE